VLGSSEDDGSEEDGGEAEVDDREAEVEAGVGDGGACEVFELSEEDAEDVSGVDVADGETSEVLASLEVNGGVSEVDDLGDGSSEVLEPLAEDAGDVSVDDMGGGSFADDVGPGEEGSPSGSPFVPPPCPCGPSPFPKPEWS